MLLDSKGYYVKYKYKIKEFLDILSDIFTHI
jgi:hypothetical protein